MRKILVIKYKKIFINKKKMENQKSVNEKLTFNILKNKDKNAHFIIMMSHLMQATTTTKNGPNFIKVVF